ncbi:MAG: hypothetical protein CMQ35_00025 [Gammaproteobacteria bacterium]|nr:hypothetical protein [Gammaproteobacteria bacterium]
MVPHLLVAFYKKTRKSFSGQWGVVLLFLLSMLFYSTSGFMYFEGEAQNKDWEDAIWWAIVSMTTVGYGDIFPESTYGRLLIGLPTMLIGVAILGYILSALAAILMENKLKELKGMSTFEKDKHIIICRFIGLTSTLQIVNEMRLDPKTQDTPIVLIDETLDELAKELAEKQVTFIKGNPSNDSVLERANLGGAQAVIIQAELADGENSDLKNLAIALNIEKMHPEINTVVHCLNPDNVRFFERCGCDSVVCIMKLVNQVIVQELQDHGIHKVVSELTSNTYGKQFYVADMPSDAQTFREVQKSLAQEDILVIGIRRDGQNLIAPENDYSVKTSDKVISISSDRK